MIKLALAMSLSLAGPASAAFCIAPVENGKPTEEPELSQPYRMAYETLTIPGYPHLVISPSSRSGLYTIRDGRFEELGAAFPKTGWWQYRDVFELPDGRVVGFGHRPNILYLLNASTKIFEPIPGTEGYGRAFFDPNSGALRFVTSRARLFDLTLDGPVPSALPTFEGIDAANGVLPRYVPEFKGHIAASETMAWFLPDGEAAWQELPGFFEDDNFYKLNDARIWVNAEARMAHIFVGPDLLTFDIGPDVPRFLYRTPNIDTLSLVGSSVLVSQRRFKRGWFGRIKRHDRLWPDLYKLTRDGPVPAPGLPEVIDESGGPISAYSFKFIAAAGVSIVWINGAYWTWDGIRLSPLGKSFELPRSIWRRDAGGKELLENSSRIFEVTRDLEVIEINLPTLGERFELYHSEIFDGVFISEKFGARLWFTSDLETFEEVTRPAGIEINAVLSDLPDGKQTLALGKDGLYLIEKCSGENE